MSSSTEVTAAAKNTPYMDLMRESCEYVAGQSQDKKNRARERREEERRGRRKKRRGGKIHK